MSSRTARDRRDDRIGDLLQRLVSRGVVPGGVSDDSRLLVPGDLFLACPGELADGRHFVADAIARGAAAVFWEQGGTAPDDFVWRDDWQLPNWPVTGLRQLRGPLAHAIHERPSERLSLIAVTGTNGKTSVTQWIGAAHPRRCAIIGTLGAGLPDKLIDTGFTTPEATTLMRCLAEFANHEVQACALEASSIGIAEGRLDGARVDIAVFTNLSRDHLDYHGSMAAYAQAKAKLFTWPHLRLAVCNLDDPCGRDLATLTTATKVIGYTQQEQPDRRQGTIRAENIEQTIDGMRFHLCAPNGRALVETGLLGRYNVANLLAVAAVLLDAGLTPQEVAERLAHLTPPAGRLEKVGGDNQPLVVVDYAHTPDALESALRALRPVAIARGAGLTAVFGCGGDRDRGKRPLMGEVATRHADRVVLTSDNPRGEDPQSILDEIRRAAPTAEVIAERGEAIRRTILAAHPAEVVLIAGKGHEAYQETAGVRRPFSDSAQAKAALAARREAGR
ncbi:UDP-N-acetylmuramoyl-L-alanyl-D-glutamate--2,6-diaminopimelate ligase [Accumulibacter sp.]|uniref:UDP-N-acetylmuramoyl-L-alanyl-D-glutamate--2, 6-diaminopimelate ligase n=1 Tax=Accumulibacter sp. TaxID=2053492 RepID=UPI0025BDEC7A|nr:UDP-N-acetylmuramoyl-L-alanyl-D-glutamate--2,6-diaminopimelate ligase [Accumulibacter sp.]